MAVSVCQERGDGGVDGVFQRKPAPVQLLQQTVPAAVDVPQHGVDKTRGLRCDAARELYRFVHGRARRDPVQKQQLAGAEAQDVRERGRGLFHPGKTADAVVKRNDALEHAVKKLLV